MIYTRLALTFSKIGLLSFGGGGYAMIALIQREAEKFGIRGKEFVDILAISQMTPGPIGINTSTYTGYKVAGFWGAACATFANCLPTFLIMLVIARIFYLVRKNQYVEIFFKGLRPMLIGLIAAVAVLMAREISLWTDYKGILIFLTVFIFGYKFKVNPILLILFSGAVGFLI
jgi:chromate transporter